MKPSEFEDYVAGLFLLLGYRAKAVGGSHDRGVDVVIEKDGIKSYIQGKKFITSEAEKFVEDKPIELISGYKLIWYIKMAKKTKTK